MEERVKRRNPLHRLELCDYASRLCRSRTARPQHRVGSLQVHSTTAGLRPLQLTRFDWLEQN